MSTLHLVKKATKPVLLACTYVKAREENLCLIRLPDGSFLVGYDSDIQDTPELLAGCIGQWLNTDDFEFARDIFAGLEVIQDRKLHERVQSVTECMTWRERMLKLLGF